MPRPRFETAAGAVNGVNKVFLVSNNYLPGSVRVFLNGVLLRKELEGGWTELGHKRVRLNEAPKMTGALDVVRIYYIPG